MHFNELKNQHNNSMFKVFSPIINKLQKQLCYHRVKYFFSFDTVTDHVQKDFQSLRPYSNSALHKSHSNQQQHDVVRTSSA